MARPVRLILLVPLVPLVLVVAGAAACSKTPTDGGTVTVTVDATPPAPSPSADQSGSASPSAPLTSASVQVPASAPTGMTALPGRCERLLSLDRVSTTIGAPLPGVTAFVVGTPDPDISRIAYLNCRYGMADVNATPTIEIGVSLYTTAAKAADRIPANVADYESNGASAEDIRVGTIDATLLSGGGGDYAGTTIVLSFGQRTVAVTASDAIPAAEVQVDLIKLAALAVRQTG